MNTPVDSPIASRRRPWLAAVLNLIWPGVGYLYAGRIRLALFTLLLVTPLASGIFVLAVVIPVPPLNIALPAALALALSALFAYDAARRASTFGTNKPVPFFSRWYSCLAAISFLAVANLLWGHVNRTTLVETHLVRGASMEHTILPGDRILAVNWAYGWREPILGRVIFGVRRPVRGDLVVFLEPRHRSHWVKRVIGLPGETVEIRGRKVLINGTAVDEPYAHILWTGEEWGPEVVPETSYFVLGDNRAASSDSRYWGFVPQDDLLGRAAVLYWSSDPRTGRVRWERFGRRLE